MKILGGVSQGVMVVASLLFGIGFLTGTATAQVKTERVNCGLGGSIGMALGAGGRHPLVVIIQGVCNENVAITRDDVTLQGDLVTGAAITAANPALDTILIDGARRVVIENLAVRGGRNGIVGARGASFTVQNSTIRDSTGIPSRNGNGIKVYQNSYATIHDNMVEDHPGSGILIEAGNATITANEIRRNQGTGGVSISNAGSARIGITDAETGAGNTIEHQPVDGIALSDGSSAILYGNTIQHNGVGGNGEGIFAARNSSIRMVGGNTIKFNLVGIFMRNSHLRTGGNDFGITPKEEDISDNIVGGIGANDNSAVDLRGSETNVADRVTIANNGGTGIFLVHGSVIRMQHTTVSSNSGSGLGLLFGSSVQFRSNNTVTGNGGFGLFCGDGESSFVGNFSGTGGAAGLVSCTGF